MGARRFGPPHARPLPAHLRATRRWLAAAGFALTTAVARVAAIGQRPSDVPRPLLRWAQTNSTVTVAFDLSKMMQCADGLLMDATPVMPDRLLISAACEGQSDVDRFRWDLELREDIVAEASKVEKLASGVMLVSMRKRLHHRWDRFLFGDAEVTLTKDWKREDKTLPEDEEMELPRAVNIRHFSYDDLLEAASTNVVVAALRFPWCGACAEKDTAFVKATKKMCSNDELSGVVFGVVDLRESKLAARRWNATCFKDHCPLHVFKPDEPLDEPYKVEMRLLYEMDEYSMMSDPMMGAPGHKPKGQTVKPDFDRFEQDLTRLLPPALTVLSDSDQLHELRATENNVVVATGVDTKALRRAARRLRGVAVVTTTDDASVLRSARASSGAPLTSEAVALDLWASAATPSRTPMSYGGELENLSLVDFEHFVHVHTQPLLQNYTWDLKNKLEGTGLAVAVLWVNFSDANSTNVTAGALQAFTSLCDRHRGTNASKDIVCCVKDGSYSYYQREYGTHEPYPYPFIGMTWKLGFGEGDRFGYPFKEPVNATARAFFLKPKKAVKLLESWVRRVLAGDVAPSHESANMPAQPKWVRGSYQEVVWKTYQREINGSIADVLLELYDNQRKQAHIADGTMRVVAATLKDYSRLKVARMETSQNYVPPVFGRKQFSKETEYYWVPPSLVDGEDTPELPVRYDGEMPATPERLLRFFKKHTLSHWSLKEAQETAADLSPEILGQAQVEQREDDRADEEKQQMIKKMMTTLKKEKGLVDVGEMMGLKEAAKTVGVDENTEKKTKRTFKKKRGKGDEKDAKAAEAAEQQRRLEERREKLRRDEERQKKSEQKEKEKRKQRKEAEKRKKELKKAKEAEAKAAREKELERARKAREAKERERRLLPTTPFFAWGQSKEQVRVTVGVPSIRLSEVSVNLTNDSVAIRARDANGRSYVLDFELREYIKASSSTWTPRYSDTSPAEPQADGINLVLLKETMHRWDRLAQKYTGIKMFMKKDWLQDDGDLEEEEDVDLPSGSNLRALTASSLVKTLETSNMVVAALRLPWCGKCVEKDRHFAKAARAVKEKELLGSIVFAVIDVREDKALGRAHNITCIDDKCPLHIFKQDEPGEPYELPGRRYSEEVEIDCYKHLLPAVNDVADKEALERVTSAFDTAIIGFFQGSKAEDEWFPRFRSAGRALRGHALFGAVFDGREPRDFGIDRDAQAETDGVGRPGRPLVLLFKPKEKRHVEFPGELTLERLTHFSRVLSLPLMDNYSFETRQKYQELKVSLGMLWLNGEVEDAEENVHAKTIVRRLALRFSGHLVFVSLNNTRDAMLMRPMGLDPRKAPVFGITRSDEMESERFGFDMQVHSPAELRAFWADEEQAYSRLESFCSAFLEGTLEVSHESADLPRSYKWPGPGVVHEVVWKTLREEVYRTEHNVLLELYSPFRPQHRTHITVLDLVAETLRNATGLKVVRMDTANNYVLPEYGLKDKEKSSSYFFLPAAPEKHRRPRRFGSRAAKLEKLPGKLLQFVHREMGGDSSWDLDVHERFAWVEKEAKKRIRRLRLLEKDYEKKMQDEWMQKEMEEFERYKRLGKFDNIEGLR